jgi:Raf kinase inhibitor-like YbhB/YbcL family protein
MNKFLAIALAGTMIVSSCSAEKTPAGAKSMTITVTSSAFQQGSSIPSQYTCDGSDISPPLAWQGVPPGAKSIALIGDDPDAPIGTWVHWVCYDIPPAVESLAQNMPKTDTLQGGGKQGLTDFRSIGYGGPCPPSGTHRYFFKVFALDILLNLPAGKTKKDIEKAMKGHILAQGELMGTYSRKR